jgi:hypothetical protein
LAIQAVVPSDPPCHYTLDIELLPAGEEPPVPLPARSIPLETITPGPAGWLRGELHSHTVHSDGEFSVPVLIEQARQRGLDFLAITDHNTVTGLSEVDPAVLGDLVIVPGMELTTFRGHALALGTTCWIDWRTGYNGWTMQDAAHQVHEQGGLFILAHPKDIGSPVCTGCRWEYDDFNLELADGIEIWNGWWPGFNQSSAKTLDLWQELQSQAVFMPATSGSDYHHENDWGPGRPAAYVRVEQRSAAGVLEGVRKGRMISSSGPWLEVRLSLDEHSPAALIGDTLSGSQAQVLLAVDWSATAVGARLEVHNRQGVAREFVIEAEQGTLREWVDGRSSNSWWAALYAFDGELLAITNPVFRTPYS